MLKTLIIHHNTSKLNQFIDALTKEKKFEIITALSGPEAYIKARETTFGLIISAFQMAGLTGKDLAVALRENYSNANTPIIIISEQDDKAQQEFSSIKNVHIIEAKQTPEALLKLATMFAGHEKVAQPTKKHSLDVNFVNPFIAATTKTLNTMASVQEIVAEKLFILNKGQALGIDISGTISMVSPQFQGVLAVCFPKDSFLKIIERMLGTVETEITSEIEDGAGELTNIIFGQTKSELEKMGYALEKTIPSVIKGVNHTISHQNTGPILVVPFKTEVGSFFIQICIFDL